MREDRGLDERAWLEALEESGGAREDLLVALAYVASQSVVLDRGELHAARRRALLLLAAGGDPRRELELEGRAVRSLAADLDAPTRRVQLSQALAHLRAHGDGLTRVADALEHLRVDDELAWRCLASALLAEELADEQGLFRSDE